jgi:hypothetical protein
MAEGKNLQIKRGLFSTIGTLLIGELGYATDSKVLYVGDGAANHAVAMIEGATFTGAIVVPDHGTATNPEVVTVVYGTGSPPTASTTPIGTLFMQYTP